MENPVVAIGTSPTFALKPPSSIPSTSATATSTSTNTETLVNNDLPSSPRTKSITPDNDPHPSWSFFPASATYIPQTSYNNPPSSPTQVSPPSPSLSSRPSPSTSKGNNINIPSSTPSTHHRILDHCFHLSIETRLKQAETQYLAAIQEQAIEQQLKEREEQHQPPMSALKQDDWRRRQRTLVDEAVVLGRKGSNVEAIVDGILKSHRSSGPLQTLPRHLKHRLHLCQLTSMVFGRFDVSSSSSSSNNSHSSNSPGLNIYAAFHHSRRHVAARAAIQQQYLNNSPQGLKTRSFFVNTEPISTSHYCRRHHRRDCKRTCCTLAKLQHEQQQALELKKRMMANQQYYMNSTRKQDAPGQQTRHLAGLVEAIPAFLKCSAMSYCDITKNMPDTKDTKDTKGGNKNDDIHKVMEGWYKLLLEMMTQAVIESYLCDGATGIDTILDVFSYGEDIKAEGSTKTNPSAHIEDPSSDDSQNVYGHRQQQQKQHQVNVQDAVAYDHQDDVLYVKTAEYKAFKEAKRVRLQEILTTEAATVEEHFVGLATKYPLIVFERQMTHYISRSQQLLADPKLSQHAENIGLMIPPTTSAYADGSLSMPVSDDEDDMDEEEPCRLEEIKEEEEDSVPMSKGGRPHLPSPPPSAMGSRSSTVSPSISTANLSEEEEFEARGQSSGKKHKFSDSESVAVKAEPVDDGRAVKKIKA
ncbi:hypothetical protein BGZ93_009674 [Podila epicladia]|nr:hypothetical protein BGZ93_009674 [Podila epicladia]